MEQVFLAGADHIVARRRQRPPSARRMAAARLVAHRGIYDNRRIFENTLDAFEAFDRGAGGRRRTLDFDENAEVAMFEAFAMSEELSIPVMVRLVTRIAHSRTAVATRQPLPQNALKPDKQIRKWTLVPVNARVQYQHLTEKQPELSRRAEESPRNALDLRGRHGVVACGLAGNYLYENLEPDHDLSVLSIGQYPLPAKKIRTLIGHVDDLLVLEDGYPFVESALHGLFGIDDVEIRGRMSGALPRTGELNPDLVRAALCMDPLPTACPPKTDIAGRPPALCKGCPHTDSFRALNDALGGYDDPQVFSDIGCYALGALPPLEAVHSCVAMGASIGMAAGAAHAGYRPAVAAIGDSTFAHGGITPLMSAVQQNVNLKVLVVDNSTVAMTGTQRSMSTGPTLDSIIRGTGIAEEHLPKLFLPFFTTKDVGEGSGLGLAVASGRPDVR